MSDASHYSDSSRDNQDSNTSNNSYTGHSSYDLPSINRTNYNSFANDGSFMDLFKKTMEKTNKQPPDRSSDGSQNEDEATKSDEREKDKNNKDCSSNAAAKKTPILSFVGKRRGGKILKTGIVKKPKTDEDEEEKPKDAWAKYMAEVKKYKQQACEEEGKTRPLVK